MGGRMNYIRVVCVLAFAFPTWGAEGPVPVDIMRFIQTGNAPEGLSPKSQMRFCIKCEDALERMQLQDEYCPLIYVAKDRLYTLETNILKDLKSRAKRVEERYKQILSFSDSEIYTLNDLKSHVDAIIDKYKYILNNIEVEINKLEYEIFEDVKLQEKNIERPCRYELGLGPGIKTLEIFKSRARSIGLGYGQILTGAVIDINDLAISIWDDLESQGKSTGTRCLYDLDDLEVKIKGNEITTLVNFKLKARKIEEQYQHKLDNIALQIQAFDRKKIEYVVSREKNIEKTYEDDLDDLELKIKESGLKTLEDFKSQIITTGKEYQHKLDKVQSLLSTCKGKHQQMVERAGGPEVIQQEINKMQTAISNIDEKIDYLSVRTRKAYEYSQRPKRNLRRVAEVAELIMKC